MLTRSSAAVSLVAFSLCAGIARDAQATPFQLADLVDPTSTPAGIFGGEILALR